MRGQSKTHAEPSEEAMAGRGHAGPERDWPEEDARATQPRRKLGVGVRCGAWGSGPGLGRRDKVVGEPSGTVRVSTRFTSTNSLSRGRGMVGRIGVEIMFGTQLDTDLIQIRLPPDRCAVGESGVRLQMPATA
jgi:hypothetical protein